MSTKYWRKGLYSDKNKKITSFDLETKKISPASLEYILNHLVDSYYAIFEFLEDIMMSDYDSFLHSGIESWEEYILDNEPENKSQSDYAFIKNIELFISALNFEKNKTINFDRTILYPSRSTNNFWKENKEKRNKFLIILSDYFFNLKKKNNYYKY